jgi:predicted outer membrane repeat protein
MVLLALIARAEATIINIPDDYPTIQQGIGASNDGDTVLVQPGTYVENIDFNGHNIVLGSLFLVTGDTSVITATIIDGGSSGTVVFFHTDENESALLTGFTIQNGNSSTGGGIRCYHASPQIKWNMISANSSTGQGGGIYCFNGAPVIADNSITLNSAARGGGIHFSSSDLTIIRNRITHNDAAGSGGGGIFCVSSEYATISDNYIAYNRVTGINATGGGISCENSHILVDGNEIYYNESSASGGGIYCENSNVIISRNTINGNSAEEFGGGVYCEDLQPVIAQNMIYGNTVTDGRGGGIYCRSSDAVIRNNLISVNSVLVKGGGIYCWRSDPRIENNALFSNTASRGGGIYCWISSPEILNNVVYGNSADDLGGGICLYDTSDAAIKNSIFWNNSASVTSEIFIDDYSYPEISYCDIAGGMEGEGNIDVIPAFRDLNNLDFHLMSTECGDPYNSPCINAGDPAIIDSLLDCSWGLGTIVSDMGAYGGGDSATVGIDHLADLIPQKLGLLQNYPNPFNASTSIRFTLPEPSNVAIEVYNILGQRVDLLYDGLKPAGSHCITWNADSHPSGLYFARIRAGERSENMKMVLLR